MPHSLGHSINTSPQREGSDVGDTKKTNSNTQAKIKVLKKFVFWIIIIIKLEGICLKMVYIECFR